MTSGSPDININEMLRRKGGSWSKRSKLGPKEIFKKPEVEMESEMSEIEETGDGPRGHNWPEHYH